MTPNDMSLLLTQFAEVFGGSGGVREAADLKDFAAALNTGVEKSIAKAAGKVLAYRSAMSAARYPGTLLGCLDRIDAILAAVKVNKPIRGDFGALRQMFVGASDGDAKLFVKDIAEALTPRVWNADTIRKMADELTSISGNDAQFDFLLGSLQTDRKVTKDVLSSIAGYYLGPGIKIKSKPDGFKAFRKRQLQYAIEASKERRDISIAA